MSAGDLDAGGVDLEEAATLAPTDKSVRMALKSLRIKEREHMEARKKALGGFLLRQRGGAVKTPGSDTGKRRWVQEAAAGSRGEVSGNRHRKKAKGKGVPVGGGRSWEAGLWIIAMVMGLVALGAAGAILGRSQGS
ncbi:unnamed protein product [Discosporangium mesarthrocarpum]